MQEEGVLTTDPKRASVVESNRDISKASELEACYSLSLARARALHRGLMPHNVHVQLHKGLHKGLSLRFRFDLIRLLHDAGRRGRLLSLRYARELHPKPVQFYHNETCAREDAFFLLAEGSSTANSTRGDQPSLQSQIQRIREASARIIRMLHGNEEFVVASGREVSQTLS